MVKKEFTRNTGYRVKNGKMWLIVFHGFDKMSKLEKVNE